MAEAIHVSGKDEPLAGGHTLLPYEVVLASGRVAPDGSIERIYLGTGLLDGLTPAAAVQLLQRCRRALEPGGRLRVAADDLDAVVERVTSREAWERSGLAQGGFDWGASRFHVLNQAFQRRAWYYNEVELRRLATMVGFRGGRRVAAGDDTRFAAERLRPDVVVMEFERRARHDGLRPSVDILIPVYRPDHFREALESALEQTWEPISILVSDDGPGDRTRDIIDGFRNHRRFASVRYVHNQPPSGKTATNCVSCLRQTSGAYVKFLFDDDVLEPRAVEKMATCLRDHPEVTLVTSHRQVIDEHGRPLAELEATKRVVAEDSRVSAAWLIDNMLRRQENFIGEPSTVLFRRADVEELLPDFWALGGLDFIGNADVTVWLSLLAQGDGIYLTESLSRFRIHAAQTSKDPVIHEICRAAWHRAAAAAEFLGLYDPGAAPPFAATPLASSPWWTPSARGAVEAAVRALQAGDAAVAQAHAEQALVADPGDSRLERLRAHCLAASGETSAALEALVADVRRNPGAAGPYLHAAEMAFALGNREAAVSVLAGAQARLLMVRPVGGVAERHGATYLDPHARFDVAPGLPPVVVTFRLACRSALTTGERPVRVVLTLDSVAVAAGELTGLGATLAIEAAIPARATAARLDLHWAGAVDVVPAPTEDPLAVRLAGVEVRLGE